MRLIVLVIMFLGFGMIPPNYRLMSTADDDDYLAVATSIAYGKFPYFNDEFHVGQKMPFASVGPGVLASPFVFAFSVVDRLEQALIVNRREQDNRYWTWTLLGFHIAVYFYLLLGVALLYEALKVWVTSFAASVTALAIIAGGGGLPIYAFRRPVMSHVFEFATISAAVLLISLALKGRRLRFHAEIVGVLGAMIFLTRYNNIFLACGMPVIFLWIVWRQQGVAGALHNAFRMFLPFTVPIVVFRLWPVFANGYSSRDQSYNESISLLWPVLDPQFYWNRLGEIVFGTDMGLIYTAPILLIAVLAVWLYRRAMPNELLALAALALVNLYIAIIWRSFGAYYGYRYLVFTAMPLLAVYLGTWVDHMRSKRTRGWVVVGFIGICLVPLASMLVFEHYDRYSPVRLVNPYGMTTYSQPRYHADLIADLSTRALDTIGDVFQKNWKPGFAGMPPEHIAQRVLFYLLPPLLFLSCYGLVRRRLVGHQLPPIEGTEMTEPIARSSGDLVQRLRMPPLSAIIAVLSLSAAAWLIVTQLIADQSWERFIAEHHCIAEKQEPGSLITPWHTSLYYRCDDGKIWRR